MSHSDIIHEILELNDKNIIIENYFTKKHLRNGNTIKVFSGKLINKPIVCPKCGHIDDNSIIAYGFTKSSRVIIPQISRYSAILSLKKQRLLCKHCNSTFVSETKILDRNCYISNITKRAIAIDGSKKSSEKDIARSNDVSHSTVNRILSRFEAYSEPSIDYLPEHLSFDEFKSVKNSAGAMSFIYTDALTGDIIDILEDRRLPKLIKYFNRFPKAVRHNVKSIIIDIYSPYISLIKQLFPKSKIILDKFHVVQLFSRALNKTRLNLMNRFDKTSLEYKILKKHWKLILKNHENIEQSQHFYHYNFRKPMREVDILNYMLNLNINLKKSYGWAIIN
jgi:transposase